MSVLVGTPSDDVPEMLATGRTDIKTIYVSMSARHPEGRDANYLQWHTLDHRPEQYRLSKLRASFRLVSTPACRAARAASDARYDATDHLMTYLFTDIGALPKFDALNVAMAKVGRTPYLLPTIERSVYRLDSMIAAPRIKVGTDVLPWWPAKGVYLLIERGAAPADEFIDVPGIGGTLRGLGLPMGPPYATASNEGLQVTYCFLDDEPATVAARLIPILKKRWSYTGVEPLLAAPFCTVVPYEWDRFVP